MIEIVQLTLSLSHDLNYYLLPILDKLTFHLGSNKPGVEIGVHSEALNLEVSPFVGLLHPLRRVEENDLGLINAIVDMPLIFDGLQP